jgi:hypothetical protein
LISLSLLFTVHHCLFQQTSVRSSTQCYPSFNLTINRSPGFGSTTTNSIALFRLAFAPAPVLLYLNLAYYRNSQAHSTKGTPSPHKRALTACRSTVSGSISLPSRGAFHLSLTVLFAIGSYLVFSLGGWAPQIQTGLLVSRLTQVHASSHQISFTGLSPSTVGFPNTILLSSVNTYMHALQPQNHRNDSGLG